ncbi:MAG: Clp protease N-terminal domain-containing protein [Egibacteraceae bacterium]
MFERFSDASRRVVVLAQDEARWLDHDHVGTEHLLLGVLDEGESEVARLLYDLGITDDAMRRVIVDVIGLGDGSAGDDIAFSPLCRRLAVAAHGWRGPRTAPKADQDGWWQGRG